MAHQRGDLKFEGEDNYHYIYNSSYAFSRTGMTIILDVDLNWDDENPFFPWFVDYSSTKNLEISYEDSPAQLLRTIKLEGAYCITYQEIYNDREVNLAKEKFIRANITITANKVTMDGVSFNSLDIF
jgi:hypothetical protein